MSWTWSWSRARKRLRVVLLLLLVLGVLIIGLGLAEKTVPNRPAAVALIVLVLLLGGIGLHVMRPRTRPKHLFEPGSNQGQRKAPASWGATPIEIAHKGQPKRLVAIVELKRGRISLEVVDKEYAAELQELFSNPVYRLIARGTLLDGTWETGENIPPSDPRFLEAVFEELCHRFEIRW